MNHKTFKNSGFTLVEVMISVTLFTIIITIGAGSVLNTNAIYRKTANVRAAMDNLSFIMEDMARNLRLGSNYNCDGNLNCSNGLIVAFTPVGGGNDIVYAIEDADQDSDGDYEITKNGLPITSPEIKIDETKSGFIVDGVGANGLQPMVTIKLSGKIIYKVGEEAEFSLQTTVSQRLLENPQ